MDELNNLINQHMFVETDSFEVYVSLANQHINRNIDTESSLKIYHNRLRRTIIFTQLNKFNQICQSLDSFILNAEIPDNLLIKNKFELLSINGLYCVQNQQYNKQIKYLKESISLAEKYPDIISKAEKTRSHLWLGSTLNIQQRYEESNEYYKVSIGSKLSTSGNFNLATNYLNMGDTLKSNLYFSLAEEIILNKFKENPKSAFNIIWYERIQKKIFNQKIKNQDCDNAKLIIDDLVSKNIFNSDIKHNSSSSYQMEYLICINDYSTLKEEINKEEKSSLNKTDLKDLIYYKILAHKELDEINLAQKALDHFFELSMSADYQKSKTLSISNIINDYKLLPALELGVDIIKDRRTQKEVSTEEFNQYLNFILAYIADIRKDIVSFSDKEFSSNKLQSVFSHILESLEFPTDKEIGLEIIEQAKFYNLEFNKIKQLHLHEQKAEKSLQEEYNLRNEISDIKKEIDKGDRTDSLYQVLLKLREQYADLNQAINNNINLASGSTNHNSNRLLIPKNSSILQYFWSEKSLYTYHITHKSIEVYKSELNDELKETLQKNVDQEFQNIDLTEWEKISQLIIPKGIELKYKLRIIPHGILNYIPFEILLDAQGHQLIKNHPVSYHHSYIPKASEPLKNKKLSVLAMAPHSTSESCDSLPTLKYSRLEAEATVASFGGLSLMDKSASKAAFIENYNQHSILHLATHTVVDRQSIYNSHLSFADSCITTKNERQFGIEDIFKHPFSHEMVVLSACNSGKGGQTPGEGLASLSKAFLASNIKTLVSTLWTANDQSSSEIMQSFYKFLKEGQEKDEAMRSAKLAYLERYYPENQDPFYWSSPVIYGDTSPLVSENRNRKYLVIGLLSLLGFILGRSIFNGYRKAA